MAADLDRLLENANGRLGSLVERPMADQASDLQKNDAAVIAQDKKLNTEIDAEVPMVRSEQSGMAALSGQQKMGVDAGKRMVARGAAAISALGMGTDGIAIAFKMTPVIGWLSGVLGTKQTSNDISKVFPTSDEASSDEYSIDKLANYLDGLGEVLPEEGEIENANKIMNPFAPGRKPGVAARGSLMNRPSASPLPRPRPRSSDFDSAAMTGPIGQARPQLSRALPSPAPAGVAPSTPGPIGAAPPTGPAGPPPSMPSGPPPPMPGGPTAPGQISAINPPAPVRSPILASTAGKAPVKVEDVNRAPGQGKFDTLEFNEAFKIAKGAGLTEFVWRERRYSTKV